MSEHKPWTTTEFRMETLARSGDVTGAAPRVPVELARELHRLRGRQPLNSGQIVSRLAVHVAPDTVAEVLFIGGPMTSEALEVLRSVLAITIEAVRPNEA